MFTTLTPNYCILNIHAFSRKRLFYISCIYNLHFFNFSLISKYVFAIVVGKRHIAQFGNGFKQSGQLEIVFFSVLEYTLNPFFLCPSSFNSTL